MNKEIPEIDRGDLSVYAFAHMYRAMKQAEQSAVDYAHNYGRSGVAQQDVDSMASDNRWFITQAEMYAGVFLAAEIADDSPRRKEFQRAIKLVDAFLANKSIPRQRTP